MPVSGPILIVADANADLLIRLPPRGDTRQPQAPDPALGGTGANTAVALRRLGQSVAFLGTIGDDGFGRFTRRSLIEQGVDTTHLLVDPFAPTMLVLAVIDQQGERTLMGWPRRGAAQAWLRPAQVEPALIERAAWVHTSGICLVESPSSAAVLHSLAIARAAGVPVSFDLNLRLGLIGGQIPPAFHETMLQAIQLSTVVLGSASDEIGLLSPHLTDVEAARSLVGPGRTVIARRAAGGVLAVTETETVIVPAFPVDVVSTVGAGDAFNAGFIAATVAGRPLSDALRWGNAVAALTISGHGRERLDQATVAALADDPAR